MYIMTMAYHKLKSEGSVQDHKHGPRKLPQQPYCIDSFLWAKVVFDPRTDNAHIIRVYVVYGPL